MTIHDWKRVARALVLTPTLAIAVMSAECFPTDVVQPGSEQRVVRLATDHPDVEALVLEVHGADIQSLEVASGVNGRAVARGAGIHRVILLAPFSGRNLLRVRLNEPDAKCVVIVIEAAGGEAQGYSLIAPASIHVEVVVD